MQNAGRATDRRKYLLINEAALCTYVSLTLLTPSDSTFETPSTTYFVVFFALIKKIFLQNLVEIIFRYHKKYF